MKVITEKRLREIANQTHDSDDTNHIVLSLFDYLIAECKELNPWLPIDENTPKDKNILVYAPPYQDLQSLQQVCKWHESAGFCIDELRTPTHYQELPEAPL
jgi:hypothetical protein